MTDLEHTLGPQLHRLADELTPAVDPLEQVDGARSRYRRQRRTRAGLATLVAATAAIAIGVPAALGTVSADPADVAGPRPGTTSTTAGTSPAVGGAEARAEAAARLADVAAARAELAAAQAAAATAEGTAAEEAATEAALSAQLVEVAAHLGALPGLAAPAGDPLTCPSGAELAEVLGGPPVPDEAADPGVACRWRSGTEDAGASVSIGVIAGTLELYAGGDGITTGCRATMLDTGTGTALQHCVDGDRVSWNLFLPDDAAPDADGISTARTWQLTVTGRSGQPQLDPVTALPALADLAGATWGR